MDNAESIPLCTEVQSLLKRLPCWPAQELPQLMAQIELLRATAEQMRSFPMPDVKPDTLVPIEAAAERLGMSKGYLYRHATTFPFHRRIGRKLLFSARGIDSHINGKSRAH